MANNKNTYYKDFGLTKIHDKDWLKKQELHNLFKRPTKDKNVNSPKYDQTYGKDVDHQADLLFLPNDNGYKYALVVTDVGTRLSDAEPLKTKNTEEVLKAFKTIYSRGILSVPQYITVDSGSEFKSQVAQYFKDNDIVYKVAKPDRHRQIAVVERTNQYLAKVIFRRMYAQEILTGETSREWVDDLPYFIKMINVKRKQKPPKPSFDYKCTGDSCNILEVGTKVRPLLDAPIDSVTDKKLHGKFRITDPKWNPEIRTIKQIRMLPGNPVLYLLNDPKNIDKVDYQTGYTKNQLQVVPKDEEAPHPSVIRGKPTTYTVEKILDRKKVGNKIKYLVKWKGFSKNDATWEDAKKLKEDIPHMIAEYSK